MKFKLTDAHIDQYHSLGYTVFRHLLPASLVRDLRRVADKARELARQSGGPNAQRLQPLKDHAELDRQALRDYTQLPELVDAVRTLINPEVWIDPPETSHMGILFEPAERAWSTAWHRDFGRLQRRVDPEVFRRMQTDFRYFHQVNCALYDDPSTWYVPGSHLRDDHELEFKIAHDSPWQIGMDQPQLDDAAVERYCLEYVESMPGGICLRLNAGDYAIYRPHGYHLGFYVPYRRRATLHDSVWNPWWKAAYNRWAAGGWMTPTADDQVAAAPAPVTA